MDNANANLEPAGLGADPSIPDQIKTIKAEVDALQIAATEARQPWFRSSSVLIAIIALLFSFGTTVFSYIQSRDRDIHDIQSELRSLIQRLSELPRLQIDYYQKYSKDASLLGQINSFINQERGMLSRQAADLIERIPGNVTSTEYAAVAFALSNSALNDKAMKLAERAIALASGIEDEVTTLRLFGNLQFTNGDIDGGRTSYKKALLIVDNYPTINKYYRNMTQQITQLYWAQAEMSNGQCPEAQLHLDESRRLLATLPDGTDKILFSNQINDARRASAGCVH